MKKILHMATFKPRYTGMIRRVKELINQCDMLRIYANGYTAIPQELQLYVDSGKLDFHHSDTDMGSQGKLYWLDVDCNDYYLTVDDDIYYPKNYVDTLVKAYERYPNCIVSMHGGVFCFNDNGRIPAFRKLKDIRKLYGYGNRLVEDKNAHLLGMGCACTVPAKVGLDKSVITGPLHSGDDEDIAVWAQNKGVPLIIIKHPSHWMCEDNEVWPLQAMHRDRALQDLGEQKLRKCTQWKLYHAHSNTSV